MNSFNNIQLNETFENMRKTFWAKPTLHFCVKKEGATVTPITSRIHTAIQSLNALDFLYPDISFVI